MNVLVVGGAGYVGSHVGRSLGAAGHGVVVLDNLSRGHRGLVLDTPLVEGDLGDAQLLERTLREWKIEAVMHFAALAYVGESVAEPARYYRNNVACTAVLLEQMCRAGVLRFVFSSSCAVYGLPERIPIPEDHPLAPINPYGRTKQMVEVMLEDLARAHRLRYATLRYFNAAGASKDGLLGENHQPETHLIPICLEAAYGLRPCVPLYGSDYPTPDGTCVRDYVHVEDLASAHLLALENLERGNGVFNVGTGRGYSVRQVIAVVEKITGRKVPVQESARRPGDPPELVAESQKICRELGWEPRYKSLEPIIETAGRWFRRLHKLEGK